ILAKRAVLELGSSTNFVYSLRAFLYEKLSFIYHLFCKTYMTDLPMTLYDAILFCLSRII
ncbi:MAG TPA: hypothetical protein H9934_10025, partial [Candidatus Anaerobutyricum faecale]|nr:hypothetical protein [Candidatus Anaerobutyricum faecale]